MTKMIAEAIQRPQWRMGMALIASGRSWWRPLRSGRRPRCQRHAGRGRRGRAPNPGLRPRVRRPTESSLFRCARLGQSHGTGTRPHSPGSVPWLIWAESTGIRS